MLRKNHSSHFVFLLDEYYAEADNLTDDVAAGMASQVTAQLEKSLQLTPATIEPGTIIGVYTKVTHCPSHNHVLCSIFIFRFRYGHYH